jgi:glycosyltransferase involved in cell wall biosynthesis
LKLALIASLVSPIREPQRGGAQSFLADLATGLSRRGHAVDVFAGSGSEIDGVRVVDVGIEASTLHEFLYRAGSSPPVDQTPFVAAYARVFEAMSDQSYDVVHNHAFDAPAIRGAVGIESPVIHTLHLPPEDSVVDALRDASRAANPPVVATVSTAQADAWRRFVDVDVVLPVGVVTAQIPWSATPGVGAVFAGRFSPEKGAVDAIAIARRARMSIDLYGDAYDDGYAERDVHAAAGQPGVQVHPAVPRAMLWRVVACAAAVLCPANWDEPFGLVSAEAQACATPVVAFRRGGLQDIVLDGVTGFLVAPGDIDAAAAALGRVSELGRTDCRRHAEAHLDIEAVLDAHERVYRGILTSTLATAHG